MTSENVVYPGSFAVSDNYAVGVVLQSHCKLHHFKTEKMKVLLYLKKSGLDKLEKTLKLAPCNLRNWLYVVIL
ncbi:hypothetical protein [Segatella salivae]